MQSVLTNSYSKFNVMMKSRYLCLIMILCYFQHNNLFTSATDVFNVFETNFHNQTKEETLPTCLPNAVCSVVHKRFWLTPIVKSFCKCEGTEPCAQRWHQNFDNRTMQLDSRSQLKFCDLVSNLHKCETGKTAIKVRTQTDENTWEQDIIAVAHCFCHWPAHWTLQRHGYMNFSNGTSVSNDMYRCDNLKKCKANEFCGNVRADTFSAYYQCSCPLGTLCLKQDKMKDYASELLYEGSIYRATCRPFKVTSKG